MNGSVLLLLLPVWVAVCAWTAHRVGELFTDNPLRFELKVVIFIALLPLLLIDELIAKAQFDRLCTERAVFTLHSPTDGRSVYVTELPAEPVAGVMIPVVMQKRMFLDTRQHEPVVSFNILRAGGGKLSRVLGNQTDGPITFDGVCMPPNWRERLVPFGLKLEWQSELRPNFKTRPAGAPVRPSPASIGYAPPVDALGPTN